MLFRRGHGNARLLEQLHGLLVHAHNRETPLIRLGIRLQHFFHVGDKFAVRLGWNHPILNLALTHAVFLSVRRTVSRLTDSTMANSTTFWANSRMVQFANPFVGGPKRKAITLASCTPSKTG